MLNQDSFFMSELCYVGSDTNTAHDIRVALSEQPDPTATRESQFHKCFSPFLPCADNHVPATVAQTIQKARQAKGLTQKELATQINEKPQIVTEYEQGKAIPNNAILGKLERVLGVKLRGKDIGAPLAPKVPAAKAPAKPAGKKV